MQQLCSCASSVSSAQARYALPLWSCLIQPLTLSFADVSVDSIADPQQLNVQLKTDPFRKGVQVCVGKTGGSALPSGSGSGMDG